MNLSEQRKAIIAGAIAGLTFFYTNVPDPDAATQIDWLRFAGELVTISLGAYYAVWVAPNESGPIDTAPSRADVLREILGEKAND